jgi:hypothetical protein
MSNKHILIGGLIIVLGIGGFFAWKTMQGDESFVSQTPEDRSARSAADTNTGSFRDFLNRNESIQCTFSGTDEDSGQPIAGTMYISGDNYYMEADTVIEGKEVAVRMIENAGMLYIWSDTKDAMSPIKFDLEAVGQQTFGAPTSPREMLEAENSNVQHSCRSWSPRSDSFIPPADLEFTDVFAGFQEYRDELMQQYGEMPPIEDYEGYGGN